MILPWRYGPSYSSVSIKSSGPGRSREKERSLCLEVGELFGRSLDLFNDSLRVVHDFLRLGFTS